ncbi:hypothetical protein LZ554_005176 [Drepanopeziza brunnea f. sp. 'monogermtubi']|nr:hypothetical protein LZ554_005176 [Drepanopeziza brunnea f. sp. 'monogermtubi']
MPLINGMKMACEPCIRGHRSTKCNHASERLMVPVRKPGRPLSACPHPRDQPCGCGSVTAAIPRKQTCHCGSDATSQDGRSTPARLTDSTGAEMSSPTRYTFKVGKPKSASGRKPSFDVANLERMDVNQVNIQQYERPQVPVHFQNGYAMAAPAPQMYGYVQQYAQMQPQFMLPLQPPTHAMQHNGANGFANGGVPNSCLDQVVESPLATQTSFSSGDSGKFVDGTLTGKESPFENGSITKAQNGKSCCAPKQNGHSHTSSSSSNSEVSEPPAASCCSSTLSKTDSMTSTQSTPHMAPHQMPSQGGMHFSPVMYPQFAPQPTLFTYPATYGSFQNPLQPASWRQSIRTNNYAQSPFPAGRQPYDTQLAPDSLDTIHSCCCGESCQCVGCAAHPYNDATQNYVRSAYTTQQNGAGESYTNRHALDGNGAATTQPQPADTVSSPTAHTPSSTTSGNGEEQNLSAADFFFVNYPFSGDGCGGDTKSCPCGDDCECLGCSIHRNPMPCAGDEGGCPCGDDCQCIGCEIHKKVGLSAALNGIADTVADGAIDGPVKGSCCGGSSA